MKRRSVLALFAAAPFAASCANRDTTVRIGSKNFTESEIVAEIYAQALEAAGMRVERRFDLGSVQIALAALERRDIDLYPEYTGTALLDVLHLPPVADPAHAYATVRDEFQRRYSLTWLQPSPMNDSQALATTQAIATRYGLRTLSDCARRAPELRLATIPEFLRRPDGLPGLQRIYGGFAFKDVKAYDIGLKYDALLKGGADVATAFTTDGAIGAHNLVILTDDRHLWPPYNVAPVVRAETLRAKPAIASTLNRISALISTEEARRMNAAVDGERRDVADVAADFLKRAPR